MCYECINMIGSELATQKFSGVLRVPVAEQLCSIHVEAVSVQG